MTSGPQPVLPAQPLRKFLEEWATNIHENLDGWGDDEFLEDEIEEFSLDSAEKIVEWWIGELPAELADTYAIKLPSGDQEMMLMLEPERDELRVLGVHKFIEFWWADSFADYLAFWLLDKDK